MAGETQRSASFNLLLKSMKWPIFSSVYEEDPKTFTPIFMT